MHGHGGGACHQGTQAARGIAEGPPGAAIKALKLKCEVPSPPIPVGKGSISRM